MLITGHMLNNHDSPWINLKLKYTGLDRNLPANDKEK